MNYKLITRHFEASPELEERINKKMKKLKRFEKWINHVEVILNGEGNRREAEINVSMDHKNLNAKEEGNDAFQTFSNVLSKIQRQIKKYEGKVTDHHA